MFLSIQYVNAMTYLKTSAESEKDGVSPASELPVSPSSCHYLRMSRDRMCLHSSDKHTEREGAHIHSEANRFFTLSHTAGVQVSDGLLKSPLTFAKHVIRGWVMGSKSPISVVCRYLSVS